MAANYTERPHDEFVVAPEGGNVESELDQKKHDKVNIDQVGVNGEPGMLGEVPFGEVDQAYLSSSKFTRFYRGLFFQMVLFSALAFCGPSITDAIQLLGGGGLASPYLANLVTSLNYVGGALVTLLGGVLINKIGIKWSCIISGACYALSGSGYYAQARFNNTPYLVAARVIGGFTNAFLYIAESTAMLSYPYADERGKYLGMWTSVRSMGTIIGGAINFGANNSNSASGAIAYGTYIVFIVIGEFIFCCRVDGVILTRIEALSIVFAVLLSPTHRVRRRDGTHVPTSGEASWKQEFIILGKHYAQKRTWLVFMPAFYSFFYGGVYGTYLTLHFSVRSRALSSLLTPAVQMVITFLYGLLLDNKRWSLHTRGWIAFGLWAIPQAACFVWTGINYGRWGTTGPYHAYDYANDGAAWAVAYLPYLIVYTTGYWTQMCLYWILGTFYTDVKASSRTSGFFRAFEIIGQAISYGINSSTGDKRIPLYINCAALVLATPCMVMLIRLMPEKPLDRDDVEEIALANAVVRGQDEL